MTADDIIAADNAALATFTAPQLQAAYRWVVTGIVAAMAENVDNMPDHRRDVAMKSAGATDQTNIDNAALMLANYLGQPTP
jgi:hypothetical protein